MKLSPTIDSLALQFAGRGKVGKLNIHENLETANQHRIFNNPRVYIFKGGDQPVQQFVGRQSLETLVQALNEVLR